MEDEDRIPVAQAWSGKQYFRSVTDAYLARVGRKSGKMFYPRRLILGEDTSLAILLETVKKNPEVHTIVGLGLTYWEVADDDGTHGNPFVYKRDPSGETSFLIFNTTNVPIDYHVEKVKRYFETAYLNVTTKVFTKEFQHTFRELTAGDPGSCAFWSSYVARSLYENDEPAETVWDGIMDDLLATLESFDDSKISVYAKNLREELATAEESKVSHLTETAVGLFGRNFKLFSDRIRTEIPNRWINPEILALHFVEGSNIIYRRDWLVLQNKIRELHAQNSIDETCTLATLNITYKNRAPVVMYFVIASQHIDGKLKTTAYLPHWEFIPKASSWHSSHDYQNLRETLNFVFADLDMVFAELRVKGAESHMRTEEDSRGDAVWASYIFHWLATHKNPWPEVDDFKQDDIDEETSHLFEHHEESHRKVVSKLVDLVNHSEEPKAPEAKRKKIEEEPQGKQEVSDDE